MSSAKKRRVGLIIGIIVLAMVFVVLPASYWIWGAVEGRRVQSLIDQYKAAGEPILPEDFDTAPIPDETNAVVDLRAAMKAMPTTRWSDTGKVETLEVEVDYQESNRPISSNEAQRLQDLLNQCGQSLADIHAAAAKPDADWQIKYRTPVLGMLYPDVNNVRALSKLLVVDAAVAHYQGDHAYALESLRQGLLLARITAKLRNLIPGLVAIGQNAMASGEIQRMAPTLRIGTGNRDATRAQVRALIDDLLQDARSRRPYHDCLLGERMTGLDACRNIGAFSKQQPMGATTMKPVMLHNAVIFLPHITTLACAVDAPDNPTAQAAIPTALAQSSPAILSLFANLLESRLNRVIKTAYRSYTEDRLAAVALAARWYAVEHDGKLPASLNDLVPKYLPEIPLDPMAAGKPLGYIVNKDRTVVYSVGESGIDEQGNEAPWHPKHSFNAQPRSWNSRNFVVHLDKPVSPQPAAEPKN